MIESRLMCWSSRSNGWSSSLMDLNELAGESNMGDRSAEATASPPSNTPDSNSEPGSTAKISADPTSPLPTSRQPNTTNTSANPQPEHHSRLSNFGGSTTFRPKAQGCPDPGDPRWGRVDSEPHRGSIRRRVKDHRRATRLADVNPRGPTPSDDPFRRSIAIRTSPSAPSSSARAAPARSFASPSTTSSPSTSP